MISILPLLSGLTGVISLAGQIQTMLGSTLLERFSQKAKKLKDTLDQEKRSWPPISILKPLSGDEPLLENALESFFQLDYPCYEIVFGLHNSTDTALPVVQKLCQRYPKQQVSVVIDTSQHGINRKVGNLINIQKKCRYDIFVISDSDIHVEPDYLKHIVATLERPNVGLVTTLYAGFAADSRLVRQLGALAINANFLPGVMMSRILGREDCLGATMVLTREKLANIGGFQSLVHHVADDALLGKLIRDRGEHVALAPTICRTTVTEESFHELYSHEVRWGRTVRSVEPLGYGLSSIQFPLFWASLTIVFSPLSPISWLILALGWIIRGIVVKKISRLTKCPLPGIFPFLIIRDWFSALIMVASATGSRVAWRGQTVHITSAKSHSANANGASALKSSQTAASNSTIDSPPGINRSAR
ncbi:bacteriohopanetetrol glucosamine biosynthesis glycosyltransferase HpnI [Aristophania vespae]|uniref:bacteriohopanetetrol glucosamine biosynthesis glycosyltransferase HpnI n=1 Tax=Aristophania vespae TaxID=2697033 RepID=UPI002351168B|nr:bacteriohopanetetrol glucosamine biosynthesis glycosyltransferase HpnI [Aristophania vespae]UMM64325.1 hypothetical protein DM15PD_13370 [Aristophania vespae]